MGFIILIILIAILLSSSGSGKYDDFAKCLTEKGTKMYGAYWCPHCQAQKKLFGSSWKNVDYVECATPGTNEQKTVCNQAGIKVYPTWVFPDGKSLSGELSLEQLSSFTSCQLPVE